jgi:hypothetical protein
MWRILRLIRKNLLPILVDGLKRSLEVLQLIGQVMRRLFMVQSVNDEYLMDFGLQAQIPIALFRSVLHNTLFFDSHDLT